MIVSKRPSDHLLRRCLRPTAIRSLHSSSRPLHVWPLRPLPASSHRHPPLRGTARRSLTADALLLQVLIPPAVFIGLTLALWAYKCLMMALFQNKIIYMPSMPPFSRKEKLSDYAGVCAPVRWREDSFNSLDGTRLAVCLGEHPAVEQQRQHLVIVYFQGNGASTPPRLPMLTNVMRAASKASPDAAITLVVPSYRGFWKSSGKPSERGIGNDGHAALQWAHSYAGKMQTGFKVVVWGQSLGAAVALSTAVGGGRMVVDGLVLETPFTSMRDMLVALYPQKWLPYRYLWPFLTSHWDNQAALEKLDRDVPLLVVLAGNDEVVPRELGTKLVSRAQELQLDVRAKEVLGSLHHEATSRREGRDAVSMFIKEVAHAESANKKYMNEK